MIRNYINGGVNDVTAICVYNKHIDEIKLKYKQNQIIADDFVRNRYYLGECYSIPLQMISKDGVAYYSDGDTYVALRLDMSVATDIDEFYLNALTEDFENNNYCYLADGLKEALKEAL